MATKTAEQMNSERRAAKAKQQAAAKARSMNKEKNKQFDLQEAHKAIRKRQGWLAHVERNRKEEIEEQFNKIFSAGSIKIEQWDNRNDWISFCFEIIQKIRSQNACKIEYNKDWKETRIFIAGKVR